MQFGRSLTYTSNRSGKWSKNRSLGDATSNIFKICFAIFTYFNVTLKPCKIFISYAIKFQFFSKIEWSTVSNFFDKSIKTPRVNCSFSKESKILSTNWTRALLVEYPLWKLNCFYNEYCFCLNACRGDCRSNVQET